jgi:hypothetical protein
MGMQRRRLCGSSSHLQSKILPSYVIAVPGQPLRTLTVRHETAQILVNIDGKPGTLSCGLPSPFPLLKCQEAPWVQASHAVGMGGGQLGLGRGLWN